MTQFANPSPLPPTLGGYRSVIAQAAAAGRQSQFRSRGRAAHSTCCTRMKVRSLEFSSCVCLKICTGIKFIPGFLLSLRFAGGPLCGTGLRWAP